MDQGQIAPTRFQRFWLPGLAFKAVVIGGGYATGRELAEFFLPSGAWGGLAAIAVATLIFSLVCAVTFVFARHVRAWDYVTFFKHLLGPGWVLFEGAYVLFIVLILAVYGAAAGAIGASLLGLPTIVGTAALAAAIVAVVTFGNASVERMFAYVSYLLYAVYALFVVLAFTHFGDLISAGFAAGGPAPGWLAGGTVYRRLQPHRRGGRVARHSPSHQRPRRDRRRIDCRATGDTPGAAVLHRDDRLQPRDR